MTNASSLRFCPLCGGESQVAYCEKDGTRTVARRDLAAGTSKLELNDIIDGRYRITGLLGRGGFGAVYAAEHTGTGQAIAVKVMVVGDGGSPDMGAVRRFYKEAQVTAQLRHPNTVRVFDVGQTTSGALYIAMELLHGDTLEERMVAQAEQGQAIGERIALTTATAVLRSLAEAHGRGLVHRDLKPANIILAEVTPDEDAIAKVLDFGIARTQDSSLTGQGTALGTPAYMSPEQCMGASVDGRSDLYSLGVILYRCVTGRLPFEDRNPLTIMYKHAHAEPTPVEELAVGTLRPGLAAIIHRALAKAPKDRFESAKAMRMAIEALSQADPTEPYEVGRTLSSPAAPLAVAGRPTGAVGHFEETLASPTVPARGAVAVHDTAMVAPLGADGGAFAAADQQIADGSTGVVEVTSIRRAGARGGTGRALIAGGVVLLAVVAAVAWVLSGDEADDVATGAAPKSSLVGKTKDKAAGRAGSISVDAGGAAAADGGSGGASDSDDATGRADIVDDARGGTRDAASTSGADTRDTSAEPPPTDASRPNADARKGARKGARRRAAVKRRDARRAGGRAKRRATKRASGSARKPRAATRPKPAGRPPVAKPKVAPPQPKKPKKPAIERPKELD